MIRPPEATVFVVDDDLAMRESLAWLLSSVELAARTYGSAQDFLEAIEPASRGCLILDVRMPEVSGLDLQEALRGRGIDLPVIIITGHADVGMAVRAMKAGAFDFIEKPFNDQLLLDRVHDAIDRDRETADATGRRAKTQARLATLTPREHEVLIQVCEGRPNKAIARRLGVNPKTVEVHRARVMAKMGANSLAALIKMVIAMDPC